jgi:glyceraldehyde-3-phosphate dehydrogenase (NADP+)
VQAGTVSVNASGLYRPDAIEYGGYKMSGFGREGLRASFHELTQVKTIALRGVLPRETSGYPV